MWKSNNFGHSNIIPVNRINTDFITSSLRFGEKTSKVKIPTRDDWSNQHQNVQKWPDIYADGSKLDGRVGADIDSKCLYINKAINLSDHCNVFQAEICAIHEAINWLETNRQSVSVRQPNGHYVEVSPHFPYIS